MHVQPDLVKQMSTGLSPGDFAQCGHTQRSQMISEIERANKYASIVQQQ